MKIWEKGIEVDIAIEKFTVGKDRELDLLLAPFDALGSIAHVTMLESIGLIQPEELPQLLVSLKQIYRKTLQPDFKIESSLEDIHSQIELMLTRELGDIGKKIHSGRSRNDQVLVDLKLFMRAELEQIVNQTAALTDVLLGLSETHKEVLMPGYTHLQVAMPSSFGLWFGAYAESLVDDIDQLFAAWKMVNRNPLGSAAGYGSSFPLNRTMTTQLLGFESLHYNSVYAQMGRGKTERIVASAMANLAATLSKLAYDVCLFMSQNFAFLSLPDTLTTGSSIMPHKKNPDVFELIRGHANKLQGLPSQITLIANNLPSGYFRDLQVMKEIILPAFSDLQNILSIATYAVGHITVNENILGDDRYQYLFSVEEVNRLALEGIPFRDAYRKVSESIANKNFTPNTTIQHTHEGSIGNLCLDKIAERKNSVLKQFDFEVVHTALDKLIAE